MGNSKPDIDWTVFDPPERKRTYHLPNGRTEVFEQVTRIEFRPSGWHRIETVGGRRAFVHSTSGCVIELEIDDWTR